MNLSVTLLIIAFTTIISYQGFTKYGLIEKFKHFPYREHQGKEWYRILTSGFLHGDWMHLILNMYVLYIFGTYVEDYFVSGFGDPLGRLLFLLLYLLNIILANIPTLFRQKDNPGFSSIGASGAISGILFIFILLNPWSILYIFFVIPLPAILFGIIYLAYSSWAANHGKGRLDHSAHFAGALAGMAIFILIRHEVVNEFLTRLIQDFPLR